MPAEVQTMFSVGEIPWHGLGHVLDTAPSCADALTLAGLDWRVGLRPMMSAPSDGGPLVPVPGARAVWRQDTGTILGTVGDDFEPLQNAAAFGFFEPLVAEGLITLETAGALRDGRRVWIMAKIAGDPEEIVTGDIIDQYLLLCHGHDGSLALRVGFNPVRVVCSNTLGLALDKGDGLFTLRHTAGLADESRATLLGSAPSRRKARRIGYRKGVKLVPSRFSAAHFELQIPAEVDEGGHGVAGGVLHGPAKIIVVAAAVKQKATAKIKPLFEGGTGNDRPGVRGTYWAALNALTEWLTHHRGAPIGTESERGYRPAMQIDVLSLAGKTAGELCEMFAGLPGKPWDRIKDAAVAAGLRVHMLGKEGVDEEYVLVVSTPRTYYEGPSAAV